MKEHRDHSGNLPIGKNIYIFCYTVISHKEADVMVDIYYLQTYTT